MIMLLYMALPGLPGLPGVPGWPARPQLSIAFLMESELTRLPDSCAPTLGPMLDALAIEVTEGQEEYFWGIHQLFQAYAWL